MKNKSLILSVVFSVVVGLFLSGCAIVERNLLRPKLQTNAIPAQVITLYSTNFVPVLVTNTLLTVDRQIVTNTVVMTNAVIQPVTVTNPPFVVLVTNGWTVAPQVETGAMTAGALSNLVVPGFGGLVSNGLMGLAGLLASVWGASQKKKADIATDAAAGLVKGIEGFRIGLQTIPPDRIPSNLTGKLDSHLLTQLEDAIGKTGEAAAFIADLVDTHTGKTTSTLAKTLST